MAYVRLTTLTPIHVGSGRIFLQNMDCLDFPSEKVWGIVDDTKVLSILGQQNIEGNINDWVSKIENGQSIIELIQRRTKNLKAEDISVRVLKQGNKRANSPKEMREQLHTHNFIPLLPGSSIKGGIRTAVFKKRLIDEKNSETLKITRGKVTNRDNKFVDDEIVKAILGETPNVDPFRFIRISDFHFESTEAWIAGSFNYDKWDTKLTQWVELIPANSKSYGILDVGGRRYEPIKEGKFQCEGLKEIIEIQSHKELFKTINAFSKEMIESEIIWAKSKDNMDSPATEEYLITLQDISQKIDALSPNISCILRIGYGIGAKYMTGDWQIEGMNSVPGLADQWKEKQRPPQYAEFEYPKTRRMLEGGLPLGFIRLDILEESEVPDLSISSRIQVDQAEDPKLEEAPSLMPEYYSGILKKNIVVPALFIGPGKGNLKVFKLLIGAPGSEPVVEVGYASDLNPNSYHRIKINTLKRNNTEVDSAVYEKRW